jgi:hypothetical protein
MLLYSEILIVFFAALCLLLGLGVLRLVQFVVVEHPLLLEHDAEAQVGVLLIRTAVIDNLHPVDSSGYDFDLKFMSRVVVFAKLLTNFRANFLQFKKM